MVRADNAAVTATRGQFKAALAEWSEQASAEQWPDRPCSADEDETADYLMMLLRKHGAK